MYKRQLAAAIAGAGAGAATGGIVGALIGWGLPEERIKEVDAGIRDGRIVMSLRPRNDADASELETAWRRDGDAAVHR